eukprot:1744784-Amphidinium_carterae.2
MKQQSVPIPEYFQIKVCFKLLHIRPSSTKVGFKNNNFIEHRIITSKKNYDKEYVKDYIEGIAIKCDSDMKIDKD